MILILFDLKPGFNWNQIYKRTCKSDYRTIHGILGTNKYMYLYMRKKFDNLYSLCIRESGKRITIDIHRVLLCNLEMDQAINLIFIYVNNYVYK